MPRWCRPRTAVCPRPVRAKDFGPASARALRPAARAGMTDQATPARGPRATPLLPPFAVAPDDPRVDALLPELERRLRPVFATMPEDAFRAMFRDIALT